MFYSPTRTPVQKCAHCDAFCAHLYFERTRFFQKISQKISRKLLRKIVPDASDITTVIKQNNFWNAWINLYGFHWFETVVKICLNCVEKNCSIFAAVKNSTKTWKTSDIGKIKKVEIKEKIENWEKRKMDRVKITDNHRSPFKDQRFIRQDR